MRVGSLFSGIGGFDLGLERAGMRIEWQVENNNWCREVLKKHWPQVPCHYDITTIDWRDIPRVDLVCGGFPCQPFSLAGKQRGKADDRYLWPEVVRCLDALRPTWFVGENVPGIINLVLDQVCADLESLGYTVWPVCVPACAVDAPHQRQRVWILAHYVSGEDHRKRGISERGRDSMGRDRQTSQQDIRKASPNSTHGCSEDVAHTECTGSQRYRGECGLGEGGEEVEACGGYDVADADHERLSQSESQPCQERTNRTSVRPRATGESWWSVEPELGRVAHGVPRRVDRLRGLGNAVVPQVAEEIGRMILEVSA